MKYTLDDTAICLTINEQPVKILWTELHSIASSGKNNIALITTGNKKIPITISAGEIKPFLETLFTHWKKINPDAAKKAAFDYSNEEKLFWKILFFLNFFLVGGISTVFLADGINTLKCNKLLMDDSKTVMTDATITKIKKSRRGNITWDLEFKTLEGKVIAARRVAVNPDVATHLPGKKDSTAPVIYSPENSSCFDVSIKAQEKTLPKAQRWFTAEFTLGFGSFFAIAWIFLTFLFYRKLTQPRPHKDIVHAIFEKIR